MLGFNDQSAKFALEDTLLDELLGSQNVVAVGAEDVNWWLLLNGRDDADCLHFCGQVLLRIIDVVGCGDASSNLVLNLGHVRAQVVVLGDGTQAWWKL